MRRENAFLGVQQAFLGFPHLDARQVAEQVALHCDFVVLGRCDEVLLFEFQQFEIVAVSLPEVGQVGPQRQFELLPGELGVFDLDAGVALFAPSVAVEQRDAERRADVRAPGLPLPVGVVAVAVQLVTVSCVQFDVRIVSRLERFQIQSGERKELALIVKADVQGSVEAVKASLEKLSNDEVRVRVIHGGVGAINESDVMLASTSQAIIVGFNVRPDNAARDSAARANVDMRMYRVIYDAINEVEAAMKGMLAPKFREVDLGRAEVRNVFRITGVGMVAGCYVLDGKMQRNAQMRLLRDNIVIYDGAIASLQRFKDSVKEVAAGYECGITFEKFQDIKEGDIVEAFLMEQIEV